jgi:hypothetical protein
VAKQQTTARVQTVKIDRLTPLIVRQAHPDRNVAQHQQKEELWPAIQRFD